ncbi:kinase-like domain, phloem protein 2-like protein [Tanacetum coccineum]
MSSEKVDLERDTWGSSCGPRQSFTYKDNFMGRLENYVSGLAHALSYIHYDEQRDFSVIHRNISSYSVLLDKYWEPILWEFQHSMKIKASERHHAFHTDSVSSTKGYTDPTYLDTGSVNYKTHIYSFGIVLLELLCGRKSVSDYQDNKYLAPVAIFHYREKTLDGIIDPDLWKQIDPRSLNFFAEITYDCLNEERSQRPNIDEIVTRLEKALELELEHENAEHSSVVVAEVRGTSSSHEECSVFIFCTYIYILFAGLLWGSGMDSILENQWGCQTVHVEHLLSVVRVIAPIVPHMAEDVCQNLTFQYNIHNVDVAKFVFESKSPAVNERWLAFREEETGFGGNILESEEKVYLHSFEDKLAVRLRNMCERKVIAGSLNRTFVTSQVSKWVDSGKKANG